MIAALPMYDWPEERARTDALWSQLRRSFSTHGLDAPQTLVRDLANADIWLSNDLFLAETCTWPLATTLSGKVSYVSTLVRDAIGCEKGFYRSAIVGRRRYEGQADAAVPKNAHKSGPRLSGRMAFNSRDSLSGYINFQFFIEPDHCIEIETGSHRASILAVANLAADYAAIDAYAWALAKKHEPASKQLVVLGWSALHPALPLITALDTPQSTIETMRKAIAETVPAVVHDDPISGLVLP